MAIQQCPEYSLLLFLICCVISVGSSSSSSSSSSEVNGSVLQCLRREYTLRATKTDLSGRQCWDFIRVSSCWGRCDSFEIPDWRFPYKISYHPVCVHDKKVLRRVLLRNCEPGTEPDLRLYEFFEAESCSCRVCNSSDTFCDWRSHVPLRHTPYDRSPIDDDDETD